MIKHTVELIVPNVYFNKSYRKALEEHCKIEWLRLAEYLA